MQDGTPIVGLMVSDNIANRFLEQVRAQQTLAEATAAAAMGHSSTVAPYAAKMELKS